MSILEEKLSCLNPADLCRERLFGSLIFCFKLRLQWRYRTMLVNTRMFLIKIWKMFLSELRIVI